MSACDKLLSAASVGNLQLLQQLLDGGLSPDAATSGGWTALHAAAMAGQLEAMQLLIQRGAQVEGKTLQGCFAPLHSAARAGQTAAMQLLLGAKAEVDVADHKDGRPLHHASKAGTVGAVKVLLDAGADVAGALPTAAWHGHYQIVCFLISTKCPGVNELHLGLYLLVRRWHMVSIQELLAAGADINTVGGKHRITALHVAAEAGRDGNVQLLLDNGADAKAATAAGKTALH
jgi:ankyrin repeat protein